MDFVKVWREIEKAGSVQAYVDTQLREHGFLIERRATDNMSARELKRYKEELKREAAEKKRLAADAWSAYKTQHIVHVGEGIYWNDSDDWDRWDLEHAEERAAENELPKLDTPQQLAEAMGLTIPQLRWLAYHREAATSIHYRRFEIAKRSGGRRPIWAPLPRLKAVQTWILRHVVERLPIHAAAHGFVAGRSTLSGAVHHTGSRVVVNMDLRDFFPTVSFRRVKGMFRKAGYREQVAILLALLCTEPPREVVNHDGKTYYIALGPRCLPQGAPTSPAVTNAICLRLDQRLTGLAAAFGYRFTRYADDMTFSLPLGHEGHPRIGKLIGTVKRIATEEGFAVRDDKTRVNRTGGCQKVTGLIVNGDAAPRVPRDLRRRLRAAIHNLNAGKPLRDGESIDTLRGWAAYIGMTNPDEGQRLMGQIETVTLR